jgi:hypothetical protein
MDNAHVVGADGSMWCGEDDQESQCDIKVLQSSPGIFDQVDLVGHTVLAPLPGDPTNIPRQINLVALSPFILLMWKNGRYCAF